MSYYATISNGSTTTISFDPDDLDEAPTDSTIENRSVTGKIYRTRVKIRRAWNISFYCDKTDKETLFSLLEENTVSASIGGQSYTCVMNLKGCRAITLVSGEEYYKIDINLEEDGT